MQEQYGAILRACRLRRGFKQDELAHELHINQSDISKIESGIKEPPLSLVKRWTDLTQAQEVLVAFICGVDGLGMMQKVVEVVSNTPFLGTIIRLGGSMQWLNIF